LTSFNLKKAIRALDCGLLTFADGRQKSSLVAVTENGVVEVYADLDLALAPIRPLSPIDGVSQILEERPWSLDEDESRVEVNRFLLYGFNASQKEEGNTK